MSKNEIRKAVAAIFPEANIKFVHDLATVTNWREIEGGRYNVRYSGKADFYDAIRSAGLIDFVACG